MLVSASLTPHLLDRIKSWCPAESASLVTAPQLFLQETLQGPSEIPGQTSGSKGPESVETRVIQQCYKMSKAQLALSSVQNHFYVSVASSGQKLDRLMRCIHAMGVTRSLVFVASQRVAMFTRERLVDKRVQVLISFDIFLPMCIVQACCHLLQATVLHGGLSKMERTNIMRAFHRGVFRVMVATPMASRGLDFPELDAVFNLALPQDETDYSHR